MLLKGHWVIKSTRIIFVALSRWFPTFQRNRDVLQIGRSSNMPLKEILMDYWKRNLSPWIFLKSTLVFQPKTFRWDESLKISRNKVAYRKRQTLHSFCSVTFLWRLLLNNIYSAAIETLSCLLYFKIYFFHFNNNLRKSLNKQSPPYTKDLLSPKPASN